AQQFLQAQGSSFQARADLAACVQDLLTETLLHCYSLLAELDFSLLLLAGGCALNSVANGELARQLPPGRRMLVPPHAGDSGQSLGALWLHAREKARGPFELTFNGSPMTPAISRPGRTYSRAEVQRAATGVYPRIACLY